MPMPWCLRLSRRKPKLFKVRMYGRAEKFGVAAFTLKELIQKGSELFKVPGRTQLQCCLYEDGTRITKDYFQYVPENTEVLLITEGQSQSGLLYDISQVLGSDRHSDELISAAKRLLTDDGEELPAKRRKLLGDLLNNLTDSAELENRTQDQDWFQGIDSRFKTKSAYMRFNCEQRIRGYLKEVRGHASIVNEMEKEKYQKLVVKLVEQLKSDRYNGRYFDRTEQQHRLCTVNGWFTCQGAFDEQNCESITHSINPYANRESRILFSTWNLDHRIEKRAVLPALVEALHDREISSINLDYFYGLLFTRTNLKLVHIVCHKKRAHNLSCDPDQFYNHGTNT